MKKTTLIFGCLFVVWICNAQFISRNTIGINEVLAIEKLALGRKALFGQIKSITSSLDSVKKIKNSRIKEAEEELNLLKKERDLEIIELKMGYFCSQCHVLKSVMEKRGENFENHLKQVNGHPIPASEVEISSTRTKWTEKIAIKTVALNNSKNGDTKDEIYFKTKLDDIQALLDDYCKKVIALEDLYTSKVFEEHKKMISKEIDKAMRVAAIEMIAWNNHILNKFWTDSINQIMIDSAGNSRFVNNLSMTKNAYMLCQNSFEKKARSAQKKFDEQRDSVEAANTKYYKMLLSEVERIDFATREWCSLGGNSKLKILRLNNNYITLTECMYFIKSDYNLLSTDCTFGWPAFNEMYLSFIQRLPQYQTRILLNEKNRRVNKIWFDR